MTLLLSPVDSLSGLFSRLLPLLFLVAALAWPGAAPFANGATSSSQLQTLTAERQALTSDLEQYQKTLNLLHKDSSPATQSSNPAVQKLAEEVDNIRQRLVAISEQEVLLLQQQIASARRASPDAAAPPVATAADAATTAIESKPLRSMPGDDSLAREARDVERLQSLLSTYHTEQREAEQNMPGEKELAKREAARLDAQSLARIPFSVDKVRLNGSEGSTALSQITDRLSDPDLAESRRDVAPICSIKTYLYGTLVGSDSRSLKPVGKNHYVARVRLLPGETTLRIHKHRWQVRLPQNVNATDFLLTLYSPAGSAPELHVFAIEDLLAEQYPHIPAWLPDELNIKSGAG